jgi:hypothetical protein
MCGDWEVFLSQNRGQTRILHHVSRRARSSASATGEIGGIAALFVVALAVVGPGFCLVLLVHTLGCYEGKRNADL